MAFYLKTNAAICARSDVLIHPKPGYVANDTDAASRSAAIERMMETSETRSDFVPMDCSSVNVDLWSPERSAHAMTEPIYKNSTGMPMHFTLQIEQFLKMGMLTGRAHICFCLTDEIIFAVHPGTVAGLDAHTAFLPEGSVWTVVNYKGDLFQLTEKIIREGGHISIGLGDYAYA